MFAKTPQALPDIQTDFSQTAHQGQQWPFISGFDIIHEAASFLNKPGMPSHIAIVCDRASQKYFLSTLAEALKRHNKKIVPPQQAEFFLFMGGETTMQTAHRFAAAHPDKPYALMPTTLMAHINGAVGPDMTPSGWHPPLFSLCDIATLSAMEKRHFRSNYAHIARLALAADEGFFSWLEWWGSKAIGGELPARLMIVRKCALLTQKVRADDISKKALGLGEDFAAAIMQAGHLTQSLFPGEVLALGIRMAFGLSARLGHCPIPDAARMRKHLQNAGFQTSLRKSQAPRALHAAEVMVEMQKNKAQHPEGLVLTRGIGNVFTTHDVTPDDMSAVIDKVLSE